MAMAADSPDSTRLAGPVGDHGGSLRMAQAMFPDAPQPWIDLSTGINPHSYPHSPLPATAFKRLPEPVEEARLRVVAARAYGAPSAANIVAAPGTQILLPMVMALVAPGRAKVLSPTYAEHARAAALAGHRVEETSDFDALADAGLAIVVNPNNPDGRLHSRRELVALAARIGARGGMLVVDEAFMDVEPGAASVCGDVEGLPLVVLRSFGKFFGLAGVRLGFGVASERMAMRLNDLLGPWAVSGPALAIGAEALADHSWREATRARLEKESQRLDDVILRAGLTPCGGTNLYRFVRHARAATLHRVLGRAGIFVRRFEAMPDALRFGLPGDESAWERLEGALSRWTTVAE
jgi:cobalamin biosynthetic protein CobC